MGSLEVSVCSEVLNEGREPWFQRPHKLVHWEHPEIDRPPSPQPIPRHLQIVPEDPAGFASTCPLVFCREPDELLHLHEEGETPGKCAGYHAFGGQAAQQLAILTASSQLGHRVQDELVSAD